MAALDGDTERAAELECEGCDGSRLATLHGTELALPSKLQAKGEIPISSGSPTTDWRVVLGWRDIEGKARENSVEVHEEDDGYAVC